MCKNLDLLNKIFPEKEKIFSLWENGLNNTKKANFFCACIIKAIEAFEQKDYLAFDAQTTSNCCHGMALFVKLLIECLSKVDVKKIHFKATQLKEQISMSGYNPEKDSIVRWIDWKVLVLTGLYVLASASILDPLRGRRTLPQNVKKIASVGTTYARDLMNSLQRFFSNLIANSYRQYDICESCTVSDVPIKLWKNYVDPKYFRTCARKITYAPCMYSTQVVLGFLINTNSKLAIVNDVLDYRERRIGKIVKLLEGNGKNGFNVVSNDRINELSLEERLEPIVVFGGCVFSDNPDIDELEKRLEAWLQNFSCLSLANDIHYPHFPNVSTDPNFDSTRVIPKEEEILYTLAKFSKVKGVSALDPSLYCVAHIFPSSLGQIVSPSAINIPPVPCSSNYFPKKILYLNKLLSKANNHPKQAFTNDHRLAQV